MFHIFTTYFYSEKSHHFHRITNSPSCGFFSVIHQRIIIKKLVNLCSQNRFHCVFSALRSLKIHFVFGHQHLFHVEKTNKWSIEVPIVLSIIGRIIGPLCLIAADCSDLGDMRSQQISKATGPPCWYLWAALSSSSLSADLRPLLAYFYILPAIVIAYWNACLSVIYDGNSSSLLCFFLKTYLIVCCQWYTILRW